MDLTVNFDVKDEFNSGRPFMDKVDAILGKVDQYQHISSYDIAAYLLLLKELKELRIDYKIDLTDLKKFEYNFDTWVQHELTERNLTNHVLIRDSVLKRNETEPNESI
ncbi:hypothetical protein EVAR_47275_1 [Eumeta japonica]|uniref:Uncharacterized protein n=1 Tax=Eumeta variegata TaxID=151549 RepID=A0A4C1XH12_EUMVA|nr:hypothetical protein EVAR_47275_1 [Eumeta japonica]